MTSDHQEIYRNRYITDGSLRPLGLACLLTVAMLMFPTSLGFGISLASLSVTLSTNWESVPLSKLVFYGLVGAGGLVILVYGLTGLIRIWKHYWRIARSRQYFLSGQSLFSVEGRSSLSGIEEGEFTKLHVGSRTFVIDDCCSYPEPAESFSHGNSKLRVWYVPSTNILARIEII